jgi:hypothetical protein
MLHTETFALFHFSAVIGTLKCAHTLTIVWFLTSHDVCFHAELQI